MIIKDWWWAAHVGTELWRKRTARWRQEVAVRWVRKRRLHLLMNCHHIRFFSHEYWSVVKGWVSCTFRKWWKQNVRKLFFSTNSLSLIIKFWPQMVQKQWWWVYNFTSLSFQETFGKKEKRKVEECVDFLLCSVILLDISMCKTFPIFLHSWILNSPLASKSAATQPKASCLKGNPASASCMFPSRCVAVSTQGYS